MKPTVPAEASFRRTMRTFARILPVLLGVLALASLATAVVPPERLVQAVPLEGVLGPLYGALAGGIAIGHPLTSYVLAGEFRVAGFSVATVTAFLVSWVTVGTIHMVAEAAVFGWRFAFWRNVVSFALAVCIGYALGLAVTTLG